MPSNPSPPPPPTTSQSDSETQISHETSPRTPPIPPSQADSETQISHETYRRTPPIPPSQSDSKTIVPEGLTDQATKDELFEKVMQEDWDGVVNIYLDKGDIVSTAKITRKKETALHIAISDSKTEVVRKLLDIIQPIKIQEMMNDNDENLLHLAASLGQAETCERLVKKDPELIGARNKEGETPSFQAALHGKKAAFYALHPKCPTNTGKHIKHDIVHCKRNDGNSILHVASKESTSFIVSSVPTNFWTVRNKEGKTSMEEFEETHEGIKKDGVQWLNSTSESCSVVAALIASVAYASAATIPGGDNQNNGIPILKGEPSFDTFIIASLVALCFSVTSLTMFLSVITSNYLIEDFLYNLPTKLKLGLTSLFISIGAMLISFCAGHFFNIGDWNRNTGSPVFAIIFLPVFAYVLTHFGLLISLIKAPF